MPSDKAEEKAREWLAEQEATNYERRRSEELLGHSVARHPHLVDPVRAASLATLLRSHAEAAYREGAMAMRERAARQVEEHLDHIDIGNDMQNHFPEPNDPPVCNIARLIRALPIEERKSDE